MKGLSLFNKLVFSFNFILVALLLTACIVPYITAENLSFLSILSLGVPVLVAGNLAFFIYWCLQLKYQMVYSLGALILGYLMFGDFVKFNLEKDILLKENLKVMSYNVHGFKVRGRYNSELALKIKKLINEQQPDIVCFQEAGSAIDKKFFNYPYLFFKKIYKGKTHLAILSKYPIIKSEIIYFPESVNNGSYADIVYKNDTIRVYNLHMQSLGITPGSGHVRSKPVEKTVRRLSGRFAKQLRQAKIVKRHRAKNPFKTIVCVDMNNTQFSNIYHLLKGNLQDTFIQEGSGIGRTYDLLHVPIRIDYIMADTAFEITGHKNFNERYSDHFPIMASLRLKQ